jgi:PAS domain S-box-containing protein
MRLPRASLGFKLTLSLVFFFLMLGGLTIALILFGFNRTQDNATSTSQEGLEDFGSRTLGAFARLVAESNSLSFERASQSAELGARYVLEAKTNVPPTWDPETLTLSPNGNPYDPSEDRLADVWIPTFLDDTDGAEQRLQDASPIDALFPGLLESVPNAIAVYFVGAEGEARYYPPIGLQDLLTPDVDLWAEVNFHLVLPEHNPERATVWVPPYEDLAKQGWLVSVLAPVYEGDEFYGAVGLDISLEFLAAQIDNTKPTANGFAFYVDSVGRLLPTGRSPDVQLSAEDRANDGLVGALDSMRRGQTGEVRTSIGGQDVYVAFAPIPGLGGSLALVSPISDLMEEARAGDVTASIQDEGNRTLQITLAGMAALFVAGLIGATYMNRRVLVRPIEAMVAATRKVAAGDLDTSLPVRSEDELGMLASSFNQMTSDLRQRRDALQQEIADREAAQQELAALFAAMTDAVVVLNEEGLYLRVPPTNAPPILMPPEDLAGKYLHEVMPADQAAGFLKVVEEALTSQQTTTVEYPLNINDRTYWFSAAVSPISEHEVLVVARDITDRINARQELERQVEERTRELTTLLRISNDVASTLELAPLLDTIIEQVKDIAEYVRSSIFLVEGDAIVLANSRAIAQDQPVSLRVPLAQIKPMWDKIGRGEAAIIEDVRGDSELARAYREASGELFDTAFRDIRAWMGVPLALKDRIIGMLTLSHSQPAFYTERHAGLVSAIANQIAVAIENARLYEQALQLAAVEERQRLARELHDSVSQALYGIALGARTARTLLDDDPARAVEPMDYVLQLAEAGLAEMRALIFELRPESLATEGLVAALDKQVAATRARYGIDVEAELPPEPELGLAEKEVFYRVAQEALHNVVKHARASRVEVRLATEDGSTSLEIRDNGVGFDAKGSFPGHMGLVSFTERAASIGARVDVESTPGEGTVVKLSLTPNPAAAATSRSRVHQ